MTKIIITFILIVQLSISFAQTFDEAYGQPIVVLIETDPWLMVIGSDVPTFALYQNGQIIYKQMQGTEWKYFEVKKDRETTQKIIKSFGITDSLMRRRNYIEASSSTDQPTNLLLLNFDTLKELRVYGRLRGKSEARQKTPKDFLKVYDNIIKFEDHEASEWLPNTVEVMATRYDHSPEKPVRWNGEWNDIQSKTTVKRNKNLYSIYLDKKHFGELIQLIKSLKEKQAVEINGKKYSLSYRFPFPNLR